MSPPRPPLLATWILRRFAAGPHAEALEGDLLEAWRGGRGNGWYWRQVLSAAAHGVWRYVRWQGPALAAGLLASGAVLALWFALNNALIDALPAYLQDHPHPYGEDRAFWMALFVGQAGTRLLMFTVSGAVLGRLQRAQPLVASALLLLCASFWRFVPWRFAPVLAAPANAVIHYLTAIGGLLLGAMLAATLWPRRSPKPLPPA